MNQGTWGGEVKLGVALMMTENGPAKFIQNAGNSDQHFSKFGGPIFRHFWDHFPRSGGKFKTGIGKFMKK